MSRPIQNICDKGLHSKGPGRCKLCRQEQRKIWRKKNREHKNAVERAWRKQNPDKVLTSQKQWALNHPDQLKLYQFKNHLKFHYRMTLEDYDALLKKQGGVCALCHQPPGAKRLVVDHCHATNKVRGLLHGLCNLLLGTAKDDPELLLAGVAYLKLHADKNHALAS